MSLSTNTFFEKAVDVPCPVEWAMTSASETGATDRVAFPCIHGAGSVPSLRAKDRWILSAVAVKEVLINLLSWVPYGWLLLFPGGHEGPYQLCVARDAKRQG